MEVGGQAVIEGVMMRSKEKYAVAVRKPDGSIKILIEKSRKFPKFFSWPLVRGALGLWFTMYDGVRALLWSGNEQMEEDEQITTKEAILTMVFSFAISALIFIVLPFFLARFFQPEGLLFDVVDGIFRFGFFFAYLLLISKMQDVQTLFQYHGAEHKSIACFESKQKLTVENVKRFSRFHPRCGTSFLVFIALISVLVFMLIPGGTVSKLLGRFILMPVIAAIGFEFIKLSNRFSENFLVKLAIWPGLMMQKITTKEPTDKQIQVGIESLKAVID